MADDSGSLGGDSIAEGIGDKTAGEILYPHLRKDLSDKKPVSSEAASTKATVQEPKQPQSETPAPPPQPVDLEGFQLNLPDGISVDSTALSEAAPIFRELNLSDEEVQKLANVHTKGILKAAEQFEAQSRAEYQEMKTSWEREASRVLASDPNSRAYASKARDTYGSRELIQILNDSGLGSHPAMVRFFVAVGKGMSNGRVQKPGASRSRSAAEILYPRLKH